MELMTIYPRLRYLLIVRWPYFLGALVLIGIGLKFDIFILAVAGSVILLLTCASAYLEKMFTVLRLYEDRVEMERGMINVERIGIPLSKITDSKIKHSFVDRILGVGEIYINTSGKDEYEIVLGGFDNQELEQFHNMLYELVKKEAEKSDSRE